MKRFAHLLSAALFAAALTISGTIAGTVGGTAAQAWAKEYKIGSMIDLSGPTSSVGQPYAKGIHDGAAWINANGGIGGVPITLLEADTAYNAQQGIATYKRFTTSEHVVGIQGFGTAVTEALARFATKDKMPYFSASYSAHLTDPATAPYNFIIAADYTTQMRAAIKYFRDGWKESRAPRIAFVYPDHPYGLAPIPGGKAYAEELGFEIVATETVGLKDIDATTQMLALLKAKPDFCWIGGTTPSTAVIMKDAVKVGLKTVFFTNIWGCDENIFKLAGDAADGNVSLQAAAAYGDDVPGMQVIKKVTNGEPQMTHYTRGFVSMLVMAEGMRIAAQKGELTGPAVKAALETLRDYDPMGLAPAISIFPDDHRPNMGVFLYRLEKGRMVFLKAQNLERKKEWLGK
ncbi:MAG: ABC transporter substrate-binding protein [Desulfovibrionaceae bacterium]|nr:ABC transporter substrate-binding protein [Desulfovibrionaceae bacterium]